MAVVSTVILDGPNIQASGQYRGSIEFTLDDTRKIRRVVRAANQAGWDQLLIDLPAIIESKVATQDAQAAAEPDQPIAASQSATIKEVAVRYIRKANTIGDPYQAYLKLKRFEDYRIAQGWSLAQVVTNLTAEGLTQEEWDFAKDRYVYLSIAARVTAMEDFQTVLAGDTWGAELRQ